MLFRTVFNPKRNLPSPGAAGIEEPAIKKQFNLRMCELFHSKAI